MNLQKLDLSANKIEDEGGAAIGNNTSWLNLEVLILRRTDIGDKAATAIAMNHTWKSLRKLQLDSNTITENGAAEIGKNRCWVNLELLDLHQNKITDKGVTSIASCDVWTKLSTLELSSNKIDDKSVLMHLCSNETWKDLKVLMLQENPAELHDEDLLNMLKKIPSTKLEVFGVSNTKVDKALLYYLKYALPQNVVELALGNHGYSDINVGIIGSNTSWTQLRRLDLSKDRITDEAATQVLRNAFWTNLEVIDLSRNQIGGDVWWNLRKITSGKS